MSEAKMGYRALPAEIEHPAGSAQLTPEEFLSKAKVKLEEAPSLLPEHAGTTIWYEEGAGYIVEVRFEGAVSAYIRSICTFTPSSGMDQIDGEFAQDAEEYILNQRLGYRGPRLAIYSGSQTMSVMKYLADRGYSATG